MVVKIAPCSHKEAGEKEEKGRITNVQLQ